MSTDRLLDAQERRLAVAQAESRDLLQRTPQCPECGGSETYRCHRDGDLYLPDTDWWQCGECEHQWGHE